MTGYAPFAVRVYTGGDERSGVSPVAFRIWLLLGGVSAVDVLWCLGQGLSVSDRQPFLPVALALAR